MAIGGGQPKMPSSTLSDIGKGRLVSARRTATLERLENSTWVEVGRYGSVQDADHALDQAIAAGGHAGSLRVTVASRSITTTVLMALGAAAIVAFVVFALYIFLS